MTRPKINEEDLYNLLLEYVPKNESRFDRPKEEGQKGVFRQVKYSKEESKRN